MVMIRQGTFVPINPKKYRGSGLPVYRSSWELTVMNTFDRHPNVIEWSSESKSIPYKHPFTGRVTMYIPDFLVVFADKHGKKYSEMIEVKPAKEAIVEYAKSKYDKVALMVNLAKWEAAKAWCKKHGIKFRVLTEFDIYQNYDKSKRKR